MYVELLLWILNTKKLKLLETLSFTDRTDIWGGWRFVDLSMFTCKTGQGSMAPPLGHPCRRGVCEQHRGRIWRIEEN